MHIAHMKRPMLAATARELADIWLPCAATPKIDGIRCVTTTAGALTRAFKPVPNRHIFQLVSQLQPGLDGELVSGDFNATQSAVMSRDGEPHFVYVVFDQFGSAGYWERVHSLPELPAFCQPLLPTVCHTLQQLQAFEESCVEAGYEGIMTRHAHGRYLEQRATLRSQLLVKFKRFVDSEARVVGFTEGSTNANQLEADAFGYAKRSGHSAGKVPRGTLGSLEAVDVHTGARVSVAGLDEATRAEVWADQNTYLGCLFKYRYQHAAGCAPRFPRFIAWLV